MGCRNISSCRAGTSCFREGPVKDASVSDTGLPTLGVFFCMRKDGDVRLSLLKADVLAAEGFDDAFTIRLGCVIK